MKKFKGTPGPWECRLIHGDLNIIRLGSFRKEGLSAVSYQSVVDGIENDEDANLIAAAPELLEALRQLRDYAEDVLVVSLKDCDPEHPMMLATSAINKALGE